ADAGRTYFFRRPACPPGGGPGACKGATPRPKWAYRRAAPRCARIRYWRHDLAIQGGDWRQLQGGGETAACRDPFAFCPSGQIARTPEKPDQSRRPERGVSGGDAPCRLRHRGGAEILRATAEILLEPRPRLSQSLVRRHGTGTLS